MCTSLCKRAGLYEAIRAPASPVRNPDSCIKHKQISVPDIYLCVCGCLLWRAGPVWTCVLREEGGTPGGGGAWVSPRSAECRLPSLRGWRGRRGAPGHVVLVCGNPALLTSHTLFSCSYKPLMPQKMLSPLWPGTAEGGGHWGRRRPREEGSGSAWAEHGCMAAALPFAFPSSYCPLLAALDSAALLLSGGFGQAGF